MASELKPCPICSLQARRTGFAGRDVYEIECKRCGRFPITGRLLIGIQKNEYYGRSVEVESLLPYLSAYTRQAAERGSPSELDTDNWRDYARAHTTTPVSRKIIKLLELSATRSSALGDAVEIDVEIDYPLVDASSAWEFKFLLRHLKSLNYLEEVDRSSSTIAFHLLAYHITVKGWLCYEELKKEAPAAVPYSPRELPVTIDFLNYLWKDKFQRSLFSLRSVEKIAALSLPCGNADEFKSRLGDLNELLRLMDLPDDLFPEASKDIPKAEKLNRLCAFLQGVILKTEMETVERALCKLRAINTIRNKLTHGGAELIAALKQLHIEYPIRDYGKAWDIVRSEAADALSLIRSALQAISSPTG